LSYSQEGEDLLLNRFFDDKRDGYFVDVGAHHPTRFSNTYFFYLKGWRGINIDAMPGSMSPFQISRPLDTNLEMGVGLQSQMLIYHMFNEPALNTFSVEEAQKKAAIPNYNIIGKKEIRVEPLSAILNEHLPAGQAIDFLSIDVEGLDYDVLASNDWDKYRPKLILVECLGLSLENSTDNKTVQFLKGIGYTMVAKSYNTVFFGLI